MATLNAGRIWIPDLRGKCVAYLRSSTRPHGRLNADIQRAAIQAALIPGKTKLIAEYTDREPLLDDNRPEFLRAIEHCKFHEATLLIGQIDRMRSNVRWLGLARQAGIKFRGADAPHINQLSYHYLVIADLYWREELGRKVAKALVDAKRDGAKLGGKRERDQGLKLGPAASAMARREYAHSRDAEIMSLIDDIRSRGVTSLEGISRRLNWMGHRAPRGGLWQPSQVRRVLKKFE